MVKSKLHSGNKRKPHLFLLARIQGRPKRTQKDISSFLSFLTPLTLLFSLIQSLHRSMCQIFLFLASLFSASVCITAIRCTSPKPHSPAILAQDLMAASGTFTIPLLKVIDWCLNSEDHFLKRCLGQTITKGSRHMVHDHTNTLTLSVDTSTWIGAQSKWSVRFKKGS